MNLACSCNCCHKIISTYGAVLISLPEAPLPPTLPMILFDPLLHAHTSFHITTNDSARLFLYFLFICFLQRTTMADLKQQQLDMIRSLHRQGILDNNFYSLFELKDQTENPQFVTEVLGIFCSDADVSIEDLNQYINGSAIQYDKVVSSSHRLKGCASGTGFCRLAPACVQLQHAAMDMDKERCIEAFNKVKNEYQTVKGKLDEIIRMERQILVWETTVKKQLP